MTLSTKVQTFCLLWIGLCCLGAAYFIWTKPDEKPVVWSKTGQLPAPLVWGLYSDGGDAQSNLGIPIATSNRKTVSKIWYGGAFEFAFDPPIALKAGEFISFPADKMTEDQLVAVVHGKEFIGKRVRAESK